MHTRTVHASMISITKVSHYLTLFHNVYTQGALLMNYLYLFAIKYWPNLDLSKMNGGVKMASILAYSVVIIYNFLCTEQKGIHHILLCWLIMKYHCQKNSHVIVTVKHNN